MIGESSDSSESESDISNYTERQYGKIDLEKYIYPLKTTNSKCTYEYLDQFPDGQKIEDLPKFPPEKCFWHYMFQKHNFYKYSKESVANLIDKRISKIADYFERLKSGKLTEKELNKKRPQNFFGPYFPSPKDIEHLGNLDILIDWDIPDCQRNLSTLASPLQIFTTADIEYLAKRWQEFQETYRFFDLRPIMGIRCGLHDDTGFQFFRMIDNTTYNQFLQWMGKDLPSKCLFSIFLKLGFLTDQFIDGKFRTHKVKAKVTGIELRCMFEIYDRYGYGCHGIMELVIGKRRKINYQSFCSQYLAIKHIPIIYGSWSKKEDLKFLKSLCEVWGLKKGADLLTVDRRMPVCKMFNEMKNRTIFMLTNHWTKLKTALTAAELDKSNKGNQTTWTNDDYVKLISSVYECKAEALVEVNWREIAKKFPGECDASVRSKFYFIYNTRVPRTLQKVFDGSVEYLYHNVTPIYKLKEIKHRQLIKDLSSAKELFESLSDNSIFKNYFNEIELEDDEDELSIISEIFHETPSTEYSSGLCSSDILEDACYDSELGSSYNGQDNNSPGVSMNVHDIEIKKEDIQGNGDQACTSKESVNKKKKTKGFLTDDGNAESGISKNCVHTSGKKKEKRKELQTTELKFKPSQFYENPSTLSVSEDELLLVEKSKTDDGDIEILYEKLPSKPVSKTCKTEKVKKTKDNNIDLNVIHYQKNILNDDHGHTSQKKKKKERIIFSPIESPDSESLTQIIVKKKMKREDLDNEDNEECEVLESSLYQGGKSSNNHIKKKKKKKERITCTPNESPYSESLTKTRVKKKRKREDLDNEDYEDCEVLESSLNQGGKSSNNHIKKKKKKKERITCSPNESPYSESLTKMSVKKKRKREDLDNEDNEECEVLEFSLNQAGKSSSNHIKKKKKKKERITCTPNESPYSESLTKMIVKKKRKREDLDNEECEVLESSLNQGGRSSNNHIKKKKKKRNVDELQYCYGQPGTSSLTPGGGGEVHFLYESSQNENEKKKNPNFFQILSSCFHRLCILLTQSHFKFLNSY